MAGVSHVAAPEAPSSRVASKVSRSVSASGLKSLPRAIRVDRRVKFSHKARTVHALRAFSCSLSQARPTHPRLTGVRPALGNLTPSRPLATSARFTRGRELLRKLGAGKRTASPASRQHHRRALNWGSECRRYRYSIYAMTARRTSSPPATTPKPAQAVALGIGWG